MLLVRVLQISTDTQVAAGAGVTTEGLIFSKGNEGAWDAAAVGNPVVSAPQHSSNLPPQLVCSLVLTPQQSVLHGTPIRIHTALSQHV